jgi:hypothetical protein
VKFDAAYKKSFEKFYDISDAPDAHGKHEERFTEDATLISASKKESSKGALVTSSFRTFASRQ